MKIILCFSLLILLVGCKGVEEIIVTEELTPNQFVTINGTVYEVNESGYFVDSWDEPDYDSTGMVMANERGPSGWR